MPALLTRSVAAAALALTAVIGLAACSQTDGGSDPKPSTSSTAKAKPAETTYNECIDGAVQLYPGDDADPKQPVQAGDCEAANVIGSDLTYELGTVQTVTVEAQNSTITVTAPERVVFTGDHNTVLYHGATAPEVDDQGEGNELKPAS